MRMPLSTTPDAAPWVAVRFVGGLPADD